jgi:predicted RNA binding protein YcfA (HicA-like mRNA interferase family)
MSRLILEGKGFMKVARKGSKAMSKSEWRGYVTLELQFED